MRPILAQAWEQRRGRRHGMSYTPTWIAWQRMRQRCYEPKNASYPAYGGRGIKVCDRWLHDFLAFYADMGERPEGTSLDRIDTEGDYEPSNCRWTPQERQNNNTRRTIWLEWEGERVTLPDLARKVGVKRSTLWLRLKKGWSLEEAVLPPNARGGGLRP